MVRTCTATSSCRSIATKMAWVTAVDFEPSARKVVHHALFFAAPAATTRNGADDSFPGARAGGMPSLGGWVPGMTPRFFS